MHLHTVVQRTRHANVVDLLLATLMVAVALVIGILRWQWLLRAADVELSPLRNARIYLLATFAGTFMPTTVGTDFVRTLLIARKGRLMARTAVTVIIDRLAALVGLVALAWLAEAIQAARVPHDATVAMGWATLASIVVVAALGFAYACGARPPARLVPSRVRHLASESHSLLRSYLHRPGLLAGITAASMAYQALIAVQLMFLASGLGVSLTFSTAAVALTVATIVMLLPISIGGFGVREGTYVVLFAASSINATDASLISLLTVVTLFIASLPGAYFLARDGVSPVVHATVATEL